MKILGPTLCLQRESVTVTVIEFSADLLDKCALMYKCALLDKCVLLDKYNGQMCNVVGLSDSASVVTAYM